LSDAVRQVGVFKKRNPTGRIAVLADHDDPSDLVSAFRGGRQRLFHQGRPL
jgi:hypothetical protein